MDTFASCQFNEVTGTYDQLIRYTVTTTRIVELDFFHSGPGFIVTRAAGGEEGGMVVHVLLCKRTA